MQNNFVDNVAFDMPNPSPTNSGDQEKQSNGSNGFSDTTVVSSLALNSHVQFEDLVGSDPRIDAETSAFAIEHGLAEHADLFRKAGYLVSVHNCGNRTFEGLQILSEQEKRDLRLEKAHPWRSLPMRMYLLAALGAGCAVIQGMDQTVINGAQVFYFQPDQFNVKSELLKGLINGTPYAAAALIGCWLNGPLNTLIGRRGTIAVSCFLALATAIWQAVADRWYNFMIARVVLGIAVGAKSGTTPIYVSESAPTRVRGALTMTWQMWTAFGIMLGFIVSLAFQETPTWGPNSQWRWMLGVTAFPPLLVGSLVYLMPESPRWLMDKRGVAQAFDAMKKLRRTKLEAARDIYLAYSYLKIEKAQKGSRFKLKELLLGGRRNRRAVQYSWFVMIMQQMCGVNVIAYYSTEIFRRAGFSTKVALLGSLGAGILNFMFAMPAMAVIDRVGRRKLLTWTFPFMAILLCWAAGSFYLGSEARTPVLLVALYLFVSVYSVGMGPVPFTYSAEAFPLRVRAVGMSTATSVTWTFNFLLSFSWPKMEQSWTAPGGFFWYACFNVLGFLITYFFLPETKGKSLEELDAVFSISDRRHGHHYWLRMRNFWCKPFRRDAKPVPPLYDDDNPGEIVNALGGTASSGVTVWAGSSSTTRGTQTDSSTELKEEDAATIQQVV